MEKVILEQKKKKKKVKAKRVLAMEMLRGKDLHEVIRQQHGWCVCRLEPSEQEEKKERWKMKSWKPLEAWQLAQAWHSHSEQNWDLCRWKVLHRGVMF